MDYCQSIFHSPSSILRDKGGRVRVAVIGCGLIGRRRADIVRRSPGDELVIVADVDEGRASSLATKIGCLATTEWQEVVAREDVEIIVVSTTNDWLAPITIAALQHGKHVLCEKPPGRNPEEARRMMEAAKGSGRKLKIGFNHRHHAAVWKAKELFDQGSVGEPLFIHCRYGHGGRPGYEQEWRADPEVSGGGELLDQGIHAIDLFRWFLGDFTKTFGYADTWFWNMPVEDNAFALFRTAKGQVASLHASWTQWKNLFCFEVFGRDGYLIVEGLGGSYGPERLRVGRRKMEGGPPEEEVLGFPGPDTSWEVEWREFVSAIRENREPLANGYDGWQAMRMVYAIYESARTGRAVRLEACPERSRKGG
jgi:predicted dehydrogenase